MQKGCRCFCTAELGHDPGRTDPDMEGVVMPVLSERLSGMRQ